MTIKSKAAFASTFRQTQLTLGANQALFLLALLGIATGVLVGLIMVSFEYLVMWGQESYLGEYNADHFELLNPVNRLMLIGTAGLLLALIWHLLKPAWRAVGIAHVIDRLFMHDSRLPLVNAAVQYLGAAIAIVGGMSVGKEGPVVHLGATAGSTMASRLGLPSNTRRTLTACGVAAAVGASFNTPLAGVVFAIEVILMEYSIMGFAPVILATVAATSCMRVFSGHESVFLIPPMELGSLVEIPWLLFGGVVIGIIAAVFTSSIAWLTQKTSQRPISLRIITATFITAGCAWFVPQVMGVGYDTVNQAMIGNILPTLAFTVLIAKLIASASAIGLGIPGGIIGPTLFIGAMTGSVLGWCANWWFPEYASPNGFYSLLGMCAMMAATLQAPLAALTAMLELTSNLHVLLPGMLMSITAYLVCKGGFKQGPIFIRLLRLRGGFLLMDTMERAQQQTAVSAIAEPRVLSSKRMVSTQFNNSLTGWRWLWLEESNLLLSVPAILEHWPDDPTLLEIDLLTLPVDRMDSCLNSPNDSIYRVLQTMKEQQTATAHLCWPNQQTPWAVVTQEQLKTAPLTIAENPFAT